MRWDDVRGQDAAVRLLRRALSGGRVHHAYLFSGPEGVGKELTARILAASLLCHDQASSSGADPCGKCDACRLVASDNHPDLRLVHRGLHKQHPDRTIRAGKGLFLAVDVVRHFLIEPSVNRPTLGRRRVFIVRDAERMNDGAQNALLKTLEEPPGATCLILVSGSAERLLPTIRSRCQPVRFGELPLEFLRTEVQRRCGLNEPAAAELARIAGGRLGAALRWHEIGLPDLADFLANGLGRHDYERPETFGRELVEQATQLAQQTAASERERDEDEDDAGVSRKKSALRTVETDELREALKLVLMVTGFLLRDALLSGEGVSPGPLTDSGRRCAESLARLGEQRLTGAIEGVLACERMLDRNVAPQLVCERLAICISGEAPAPAAI